MVLVPSSTIDLQREDERAPIFKGEKSGTAAGEGHLGSNKVVGGTGLEPVTPTVSL